MMIKEMTDGLRTLNPVRVVRMFACVSMETLLSVNSDQTTPLLFLLKQIYGLIES